MAGREYVTTSSRKPNLELSCLRGGVSTRPVVDLCDSDKLNLDCFNNVSQPYRPIPLSLTPSIVMS